MHYLDTSHAYPGSLGFGSARIWDMGVDWAQLQPNAPATTCTSTDPILGTCTGYTTTDGFDANALARLDSIVQMYTDKRVDPLLVLGQTPQWAQNPTCRNYPSTTCAPAATDANSPWGIYVRTITQRYDGNHGHPKVSVFETWNEANLSVGYTDSVSTLAAMQATAYSIIHGNGAGQLLTSPSFAQSYGRGWASTSWLNSFLGSSGGTKYDITNLHLYPDVPASKANYGPEGAINRFAQLRTVLSHHGVNGRPIWNTETNIGSTYTGTAGAAQVVRTLVLSTEKHVARTYWYAADSRSWGGVFLENSDFKTLAAPGVAFRWAATHLTGARPYGCVVKKVGTNRWNYTCKYHLANRKNMLVVWTTGNSYHYHGPSGTRNWYSVTGASHRASYRTRLTVSHTPLYVVGTFKI
jgi:hypothetical protein